MENDPSAAEETLSQVVTDPETGSVCRKTIQVQDVCPICQEELLEKKQPVSYCRFGCGNNVHISCVKVWADHQRLSDREQTVKCPLCREDFSSLKCIQEQMKNTAKLFTAAERKKPDRHLGDPCHSCRVCPVISKCFKILHKSNSCPLDGYVIYDPLTWSSTERKTSPQSASCLSSDCAKQPEKTLKDLFIPGVALRDRNTKVTPSYTFLNLEVLTDSSVTFNTPQKSITDSFQGLCIASDSMVKEGRRELQRTLIPESSSACDQLSKSDSSAHSSKKTTVKHSPASPNRCAMVVKIMEQPQLDLFVGLRRPESNHKATVAFPARRTRVQLKRTGTVTMTDTNNTLISELKMTGVLINTQQQRKKKT
ncbi:hypothetical protein ABVT39_027873 [Epinephelus coioides]